MTKRITVWKIVAVSIMALFIAGCGGDDDEGQLQDGPAAADFSGTYQVFLTQGGIDESQNWIFTQEGSSISIRVYEDQIVTGAVSGRTVSVPQQSITIEGEVIPTSMSLVFSEDNVSFAGNVMTNVADFEISVPVSGTKIG